MYLDKECLRKRRTYLSFVRFSHSVFALPFALTGALLASRHHPVTWRHIFWIVVCMVTARSAAMGFNRLVDARFDAENPRTRRARCRAAGCRRRSAAFVAGHVAGVRGGGRPAEPAVPDPVAGRARRDLLVFAREAIYVGDAVFSRPRDGHCACRRLAGRWRRGGMGAMAARAGDCLWVGGFDVLYACQDLDVDRRQHLKSIPVRFGVARSLWISRAMHARPSLLALLGAAVGSGCVVFPRCGRGRRTAGVRAIARQRNDLSQVKRAFDLNGYVGILYFVVTAISVYAGR